MTFPPALACVLLVFALAQGQDGVEIANDSAMFSERFRVEFREMNDTFEEFGFELEVIDGERPSLTAIKEKYGDPEREEPGDVTLWIDGSETKVTLTFYYFGDIGFGIRPADPEPTVIVVKRRAG